MAGPARRRRCDGLRERPLSFRCMLECPFLSAILPLAPHNGISGVSPHLPFAMLPTYLRHLSIPAVSAYAALALDMPILQAGYPIVLEWESRHEPRGKISSLC